MGGGDPERSSAGGKPASQVAFAQMCSATSEDRACLSRAEVTTATTKILSNQALILLLMDDAIQSSNVAILSPPSHRCEGFQIYCKMCVTQRETCTSALLEA